MQLMSSTSTQDILLKSCAVVGQTTGSQVLQPLQVPRGDTGVRGLVAHTDTPVPDEATLGPGMTRERAGCIFYFLFSVKTNWVTADYSVFTGVFETCIFLLSCNQIAWCAKILHSGCIIVRYD